MPRKQDRYADKAANQIRINGETITAGQNVRENAERTGDRPADSLRRVARYAQQRRREGDDPVRTGIGSTTEVVREYCARMYGEGQIERLKIKGQGRPQHRYYRP